MKEKTVFVIAHIVGDSQGRLDDALPRRVRLVQAKHISNDLGDRMVKRLMDGLFQLGGEVKRSGQTLQELSRVMVRFPQVLINVKNVAKERLASSTAIADAVKAAEAELGSNGRVLLRASGTEPLVRVMVEAQSDAVAQSVATKLAQVVETELR